METGEEDIVYCSNLQIRDGGHRGSEKWLDSGYLFFFWLCYV